MFDQTGTPTVVNETVTSYIDDILGHHIGYFVDETGAPTDVTESITDIQNTIVGHKIADYTNEQTGDIDLPVINIIVFLKKKNWFKRMILWIKNLF